MFDALLDQPLLGFDTKIPAGQQIHHKELAGTERTTSDIKECVLLSQSEQSHKSELHIGKNIVGLRVTYKRTIMAATRGDIFADVW